MTVRQCRRAVAITMSEKAETDITFVAAEDPGGGYVARAIDHAIFTQADSRRELQRRIREAITCHFEPTQAPARLRIRFE